MSLKEDIEHKKKYYKQFNHQAIILVTLAELVSNNNKIDFATREALVSDLYSRISLEKNKKEDK